MLETVKTKVDIKNKIDDQDAWDDKKKLEKKKEILIFCPHCNANYIPCEIFMPGTLIGKTTDIVKDSLGAFVYADFKKEENLPARSERFTCEYCDKPFIVEVAPIIFNTKKVSAEEDFSTEYVPLI